jgi:hypothetical protein
LFPLPNSSGFARKLVLHLENPGRCNHFNDSFASNIFFI